jgi:prepilin-type N-terminal cleavage/methylation domain-containing protein
MKKQSGFTLVELAIVLMIIGLLIGGILKGQELINNARVTSTIRQVQSYDAAVTTFRDSYGMLPGDITNPSARIPNCTTTQCNTAGNNNGRIETSNFEYISFWLHLANTNLISGINTAATTNIAPKSLLNGVFHVNQNSSGKNQLEMWDPNADSNTISASQAARMDRKMDDGMPLTGDVGTIASDDNCYIDADPWAGYNEALSGNNCSMFFIIQN